MLQKIIIAIKKQGLVIVIIRILYLIITKLSVFFSTIKVKSYFKVLGCSYGQQFKTDGKIIVRINKRSTIKIGNNFKNNSRYKANLVGLTNPTTLQCFDNGTIIIGNNTGFSGVVISARKKIQIGNNVMIGGNVRIFDHDYHSLDYKERHPSYGLKQTIKSAEVLIGNDVFIGTNAIILKSTNIGDRAIIGANAVVSNINIPPDSVVAGNPAKILKKITKI